MARIFFKPIAVFVLLCISFLFFSISIYVKPLENTATAQEQQNFALGRSIWQNKNCQSCHQIYGLGGYLGPDLTNEYSKLNGNEAALKHFFKGGIKQMPRFELTAQEEAALIYFLKEIDKSGSADPRTFIKHKNGMITQHEQ